MCGACGTKGAVHWSAPFLATQPARSVAATMLTALARHRVKVAATAGGYLVDSPTGHRRAVADLGAAWAAVPGIAAGRLSVDRPSPLAVPAAVPQVRGRL